MPRYIDADALIDDIRKHSESYFADDFAHEWVDKQPSADVKPIRHGHWIRGSSYPHHVFCSICYATYVPNDEWDIWKTDGSDCFRLQRNFCPYCGADMRGEQNDG